MSALDGSDLRGAAACISDAQTNIATAKEYLANVMDNMQRYADEMDKVSPNDSAVAMIKTYRESLTNVKNSLDEASDL